MDCCAKNEGDGKKTDNYEMGDERRSKMNKRIVLWVVIGLLFAVALFLTFKAGAGTGNVVQTASAAQSAASSASSGMVGGC